MTIPLGEMEKIMKLADQMAEFMKEGIGQTETWMKIQNRKYAIVIVWLALLTLFHVVT